MSSRIYEPGECYQYPLIIKKLLPTPLMNAPDREIVYRNLSRQSYRNFAERVHRLAGGLESLGVGRGDTVAVFDYDSHRYLESFFAIPMMGAVMQTANWRLSMDQILYTLRHAGPKVILTHSDFVPILEGMSDRIDSVDKIVLISDDGSWPATKIPLSADYEGMLEASQPSYEFPDLDENTQATIFYTTGTTGNPKGVHFTHRQLVLHTLSVALACGAFHSIGRFRSNDVYMPLTPMFHVHAWGFPYVSTLLGSKQVYPGRYEPETILRLVADEGVTFTHCVPTVLRMVISHPLAKELDLSNWKLIIGGAHLSRGLARAAMDLGIEILAGYGMSETCPVMCLADLKEFMLDWEDDKKLDLITKAGKSIPLAEFDVFDPEDKALPHDGETTGEIVMRSPWLTPSYVKEPERTKDLWRSGWLHSGDVGHIDQEGYVLITDRLKDVIKSGGEWISSLDLENLMSQHEAVLESAAIGIPDEKWGERPLMVVIIKPEFEGKVSGEALEQFMKKFVGEGKLPSYAVPDRFDLVEQIPKTSVGKVDKKELRKSYT